MSLICHEAHHCCDNPSPYHSHFLPPAQCPGCDRVRPMPPEVDGQMTLDGAG